MTTYQYITKKTENGYRPGYMTWAVVAHDPIYGDDVIEMGFTTKKAAEAWLARFLAAPKVITCQADADASYESGIAAADAKADAANKWIWK
jgi:hypothetical protein